MGTDAALTARAAPALLFELSEHLRNTGNTLPTAQALDAAIRAWIDGDQPRQPAPADQSRGYQWRQLFLPHSTELRMECAGITFYRKVVGDDILYGGRSVAPRAMTIAIAGQGRNAWRDLWLRLPVACCWKRAMQWRREDERHLAPQLQAQAQPPSPTDSMAAAAAAMSDALKITLALAQHCNAQSMPAVERRARKQRRGSARRACRQPTI